MNLKMNALRSMILAICAVLFFGGCPFTTAFPAYADTGGKTAEEIAAELSNPNAVLGTMGFNLDYATYKGDLANANKQSALRLSFQPSLPYPLTEDLNFFLRPVFPIIIRQDVPEADGFNTKGINLGDVGFDAAIGKTFSNGMILIGGLTGTMPTATDKVLGGDQWLLGPEFFVGHLTEKTVIGVLLTHQWYVAGCNDYHTNVTGGQYFLVYNFSNAWQFSTSPTFSYDHHADSGQRFTFPLGAGIAKTVIIDGQPLRFGLQYWHYLSQADQFGPDWQIRFTFSYVVPLPWGK